MDVFSFVVKEMMIGKFMKRVILLNIFKLYDLLGLVFVVMIKVKIVLQNIWRLKYYDWDDFFFDDMVELW